MAIKRIRSSIKSSSERVLPAYQTVTIVIAGSSVTPDISISCREPDEMDAPVTLLPEAVVEVISKGFEAKDYEIGLQFYLAQGIKDVIMFDPSRSHVLQARADGTRELTSPTTISLECGCVCTV